MWRRAGSGSTGKYDIVTSAPPTPDISVADGLFSLAVTPEDIPHYTDKQIMVNQGK